MHFLLHSPFQIYYHLVFLKNIMNCHCNLEINLRYKGLFYTLNIAVMFYTGFSGMHEKYKYITKYFLKEQKKLDMFLLCTGLLYALKTVIILLIFSSSFIIGLHYEFD